MVTAPTHPARSRQIELPQRGGCVHGLEFGPTDRPLDVLFLHANGFNAGTYRSILQPLSDRLHILAIDQRGHGGTRLPASPWPRPDWYDLQDDLVSLLDQLDLRSVVLAGHSMGGAVSLLAAAMRPERIKALVLFDPVVMDQASTMAAQSPDFAERAWNETPLAIGARKRRAEFPDRATAFKAYKGKGAFKTWPDQILADYVEAGFIDTPEGMVRLACDPGWEASNFVSQGHDIWAIRDQILCPVSILQAEQGSTCRVGDGQQFLATMKQASIRLIPDSSHFLPMERIDLVQQALLDAV